MRNIGGATKVKGGFYWDRKDWEMAVIPADGGTLPGDATHRFLKVPVLALLVLGPIMGALFVVFLPVVGIYLLARNLFTLATRALGRAAHRPAHEKASSR